MFDPSKSDKKSEETKTVAETKPFYSPSERIMWDYYWALVRAGRIAEADIFIREQAKLLKKKQE